MATPFNFKLDRIKLQGLTTNCIIGVFPHERNTPQPLTVNLCLYVDTRLAGASCKLSATVDYSKLAAELEFILGNCRFRLLETAADVLCRYILAPALPERPQAVIEAVKLELVKPSAFETGTVAALEVFRSHEDVNMKVEKSRFGEVDVIAEFQEVGIYRLRIDPGKSIPTHIHRQMSESEMPLSDGLLVQNKPARAGLARSWPKNFPHRYDNPTNSQLSLLCIDRPRFTEDDEVEDPTPAAGLKDLDPSLVENFYRFNTN